MLDECAVFEGAPKDFTTAGQKRHIAVAAYLEGNKDALNEFEEEERENLIWYADYVKIHAPMEDYPMVLEKQRKATLPNGLPIEGTPDLTCGPVLLDLKWRPRDYRAQIAAYAYMLLEELGPATETLVITAHVCYAQTQTVRVMKFDIMSAWDTIKEVIERAESVWKAPTPCSYCGWCAKNKTCSALIQQVNTAIQSNPEWDLPQWHSSKMETAQELGLALKISRTLKDWCESVEFHCKESAIKKGVVPAGYELKSRQGNRFIPDVGLAFQRIGLPQPEFIKACTVKHTTLSEIYAAFHGMKKAPALREVEGRLGDAIQRKNPANMLVEIKTQKTKKAK